MLPSWHRKAQRLAAAAHVDGDKPGCGEAARAAVALFVDLELALAGAKLGGAAPVQWPVPDLEGAVLGVDRLGERENLLGLTGDVRMQAAKPPAPLVRMGISAPNPVPCGDFNSSTMIVMMMAMTPSLKASSRPVPMGR